MNIFKKIKKEFVELDKDTQAFVVTGIIVAIMDIISIISGTEPAGKYLFGENDKEECLDNENTETIMV